jgi:hypothetical protein
MTTAQQIHSSKPKRVDYGQRTAIVTTFARSQSGTQRSGERVVSCQWSDNTITAKHIKGDGRTPSFQCFSERSFNDMDEVRVYARECLA